MDVVNTRPQIGVGLKFVLDEFPEQSDVKVRVGIGRLSDVELVNRMGVSFGRRGRDWKRLRCVR